MGLGRIGLWVIAGSTLMVAVVAETSAPDDPWICCRASHQPAFMFRSECPTSSHAFVPGTALVDSSEDAILVYGPADLCGRTLERLSKLAPVKEEWRLGATWKVELHSAAEGTRASSEAWPSAFPTTSAHTLMSVIKPLSLGGQTLLCPDRLYILRARRTSADAWALVVYDHDTGRIVGDEVPFATSPRPCNRPGTNVPFPDDQLALVLSANAIRMCWGGGSHEIPMAPVSQQGLGDCKLANEVRGFLDRHKTRTPHLPVWVGGRGIQMQNAKAPKLTNMADRRPTETPTRPQEKKGRGVGTIHRAVDQPNPDSRYVTLDSKTVPQGPVFGEGDASSYYDRIISLILDVAAAVANKYVVTKEDRALARFQLSALAVAYQESKLVHFRRLGVLGDKCGNDNHISLIPARAREAFDISFNKPSPLLPRCADLNRSLPALQLLGSYDRRSYGVMQIVQDYYYADYGKGFLDVPASVKFGAQLYFDGFDKANWLPSTYPCLLKGNPREYPLRLIRGVWAGFYNGGRWGTHTCRFADDLDEHHGDDVAFQKSLSRVVTLSGPFTELGASTRARLENVIATATMVSP